MHFACVRCSFRKVGLAKLQNAVGFVIHLLSTQGIKKEKLFCGKSLIFREKHLFLRFPKKQVYNYEKNISTS